MPCTVVPRSVAVAGLLAVVLTACGGVDGTEGAAGTPRPTATATGPAPPPTPSPVADRDTPAEPTPAAPSTADDGLPRVVPLPVLGRDESAGTVLSPCSPVEGVEARLVIGDDGPRPDEATMEAALGDFGDDQQLIDSLVAEGQTPQDALHEAYAQVVGLFHEDLSGLPGLVNGGGRIASPSRGEPFVVAFTGDVPDGFQPPVAELDSYGLVVVTGAAGSGPEGYDESLFEDVRQAAADAGLRVVDVADDVIAGTLHVTVRDREADEDVVAAFESALAEPDRVCVTTTELDIPCDDEVVADARSRAVRQGEVVPGGTDSEEAAAAVVASHLGLDAEDSRAKAEQEQRAWRVGYEDGIGGALTADLSPGRITVTTCLGVVVDGSIEGVRQDG